MNFLAFGLDKLIRKDRLIYTVKKDIVTVIVIAAKGHYFDN
jgi:hypothetical protein